MKEVAREYDRDHFPDGVTTPKQRLDVLLALTNKLRADRIDASCIIRHDDLVMNSSVKGGWAAYK